MVVADDGGQQRVTGAGTTACGFRSFFLRVSISSISFKCPHHRVRARVRAREDQSHHTCDTPQDLAPDAGDREAEIPAVRGRQAGREGTEVEEEVENALLIPQMLIIRALERGAW